MVSIADICVMYSQGSWQLKLKVVNAPALLPLPTKCPRLLTSMKLKALSREEGNNTFLLHVSVTDEPAEQPEDGEISPETAFVHVDMPQMAEAVTSDNIDVFAKMLLGGLSVYFSSRLFDIVGHVISAERVMSTPKTLL